MHTLEHFEAAVKALGFRLTSVNLCKCIDGFTGVKCGFYDNEDADIHIMWNPVGEAYMKQRPLSIKMENAYLYDRNFYGKSIAFPNKEVYWRDNRFDLHIEEEEHTPYQN